MLAKCARCQNNFTTDHYGSQICPHCGAEIILEDPFGRRSAADQPEPPAAPSGPGAPPPGWGRPAPGWGQPPGAAGGSGAGGWPGARGPGPGGTGGEASFREVSAPFARRSELGFFAAFLQTWRLVALEPFRFFSELDVRETGAAVLFGTLSMTVGSWVSQLFSLRINPNAFLERFVPGWPTAQPDPFGPMGHLWLAILTPIICIILLFIVSGIVHVALLILQAAPRGFDATLTVMGYAFGLWLLGAVPFVGSVTGVIWSIVAGIIGISAAQRCSTGKAVVAGLSPLLLACCCCCAFWLLIFGGISMSRSF